MFIPIYDRNHLRHIRYQRVTIALIAANCLVFAYQLFLGAAGANAVIQDIGITPATLMASPPASPQTLLGIPAWLTPVTYMFLHGDWTHLGANMLFLWVFGDNVEDAMGHWRFLLFYLICGVAAGFAHVVAHPASTAPLIGASGAISGVFAAYVLLYPKIRVWVLPIPFIPLLLPILWIVIAWLGFQIYFITAHLENTTAWWAHLGGFAAGAVLILFMRRPETPLFGKAADHAPNIKQA